MSIVCTCCATGLCVLRLISATPTESTRSPAAVPFLHMLFENSFQHIHCEFNVLIANAQRRSEGESLQGKKNKVKYRKIYS